jgi:hemolysin III
MSKSRAFRDRRQSVGEEIANSLSHGLGLVASLAAAPVLVLAALQRGGTAGVVGASVFSATTVLLYLSSTLYHALPWSRAKRVFRILDHGAIYLLIAGTYTPFTLGVLRGSWGWTLFGIVWSVALAGVVLKASGALRHGVLSTGLYVLLGWVVLIAARPLFVHVPAWGLFWLAAGGVAYTGGVAFFAATQVRFSHFVWHIFVLVGTACHFIAVLWYAG